VNETHREDGEAYPPKTLYQMLCSLQWYMQKNDPQAPAVLNKRDARSASSRQGLLEALKDSISLWGVLY